MDPELADKLKSAALAAAQIPEETRLNIAEQILAENSANVGRLIRENCATLRAANAIYGVLRMRDSGMEILLVDSDGQRLPAHVTIFPETIFYLLNADFSHDSMIVNDQGNIYKSILG